MKTKTKSKDRKRERNIKRIEPKKNIMQCSACGFTSFLNDFILVETNGHHDDYIICVECNEFTDL